MITIQECKSGNETYFRKTVINNNKLIQEQLIYYRAVVVPRNGKDYFVLYNSDMQLKSNAFSYINNDLADKSRNTQIRAHEALKFLFCFEDIIGKSLKDFTSSDVDNLKYFLKGFSPAGNQITFENMTIRSNDTINGYLSVYRNYLRYMGIGKHSLFNPSGKTKLFMAGTSQEHHAEGYAKNEKTPRKFVEVPKYISVDEFVSILEYVREHYSLREEIIIRLMYQCGLRIGEVLGLTADDLVMEQLEDGSYAPLAYIRNRVSDNKDQCAKTCMKVISKKQYASEDYNTLDFGYQYVVVPQDLFDLINDYIENNHTVARDNDNSYNRYAKKTIADRVRSSSEFEDDNYYIFINSIGTPLSGSSWNSTMRDIFDAVGIKVDKNKKKNNLNHRFRHGFAMYHVIYLGTKSVQLAKLLRHSGTSSVLCYYQPTITDQIKLKTDFACSLYEIIPTLKREE